MNQPQKNAFTGVIKSEIISAKKPTDSRPITYGFAKSPFGECFVAIDENNAVCAMDFCDNNRDEILSIFKTRWQATSLTHDDTVAVYVVKQITSPHHLPQPLTLLLRGTEFQINVWQTLLEVPFGTTISYSDLARRAGNERAVRAVASAVARNPISVIVPCHRIVRNDGKIGQYHWGIERKRAIIMWEQEQRDNNHRITL